MKFDLYKALEDYNPKDAKEIESLNKTKEFLKKNDNCFSRTNLSGHITAGALLIDENYNVLLNHHKILDEWFHFGGHSDGDCNSLNVAKREVMEESGIVDVDDLGGKIFDIDVHIIPENLKKNEPVHYHYDIRFLFITKCKSYEISNESKEIKWVTIEEAKNLVNNPAILRMLDKVNLRKIELEENN